MKKWMRNWKVQRCLDEDVDLPEHLKAELRQDIKEWRCYQDELRMICRLKSDADGAREQPSPFLRTRIMHAVRHAEDEAPSLWRAMAFPVWARALTVVTFLVVAGSLVLNYSFFRSPEQSVAAGDPFNQTANQVIKIVEMAEGARVHTLGERINQPLEREVELALGDARVAVNQLALQFIPETMMPIQLLANADR